MSWKNDIRVVISIDFGTTYSGFAYSNKINPEIITNDTWPEQIGQLKTNTVLQYDKNFKNVEEWGYPALAKKPRRNKGKSKNQPVPKPVEHFKLHLGSMPDNDKPLLPKGLNHKKAITDYLKSMDTINTRWPNIKFMDQALIILTVPAEFTDQAKAILRDCIYNAELIKTKTSEKLQFSTEPEAAAVHCMKVLKEHLLDIVGTNFLIVDCGGGTVDLTTRQLLSNERLGEKTIRTGGFCGGIYVDRGFLAFIGEKVGPSVMQILQESHYGQLQYMVQEFCKKVKLLFTGYREDYKTFDMDLDEVCPVVKQYVTGSKLDKLEEDEWIVELKFEDVKKMFDPVIKKILKLIRDQLNRGGSISAMFLVGGFSESKYLQKRIREEFSDEVRNISVPPQPMAAIVRGALEYGLNMQKIKSRTLPLTYGIELAPLWKEGDPPERKQTHGRIFVFRRLVSKGIEVDVDQEFGLELHPSFQNQIEISIEVYATTAIEAKFCDEPGMKKIGELRLDFPDPHLGFHRKITFTLTFGQMEIRAYARNQLGQSTNANFELEL
ncbi:16306_t:CDS:2 [Funneliformis mosseae]|uniref:16306_t:CDS:1 n=1 Tax=Funneliformis mosseae TaxID=27381 RepID=A0A9N9CK01_FUNMO|nr:16306_t:CDS:2 [Funneliformis mosseae]